MNKHAIRFAWLICIVWISSLIASYITPRFEVPVVFDILMPMVGAFLLGMQIGRKGSSNGVTFSTSHTPESTGQIPPPVEVPVWPTSPKEQRLQEMASPEWIPESELQNQRSEVSRLESNTSNGEDSR